MLAVNINKKALKPTTLEYDLALRLLGMSWGVKTTCLEAPGVSVGGSGVSIGGVGSLRVGIISKLETCQNTLKIFDEAGTWDAELKLRPGALLTLEGFLREGADP